MGIIVSKFGGSSTANAENLKCIDRLIRAAPSRRCVVLSAPGIDAKHPEKVTAMLERCWDLRKAPATLDGAVSAVAERFRDICDGLGVPDVSQQARRQIHDAVAISLPHTLSRGEYLSALVFARYTGLPMVDAAELIAFNADGTLDERRTRLNLKGLRHREGPVIVPGFYGAGPDGVIRVLPRNGSDITGALVAAGMDADLYENWSDVPGLMTADPALVPNARLIPHIGYRQMRALSRAGARVLHPACLDPVAMAGIPTRLRNTMCPDSFGTLIDERCERTVPCIAGRPDAYLPDIRPAALITVFGIACDRVLDVAGPMAPLGTIAKNEQTVVYFAQERYADAMKHLHRVLIENQD
ncbi:MAG: aspartate kinase [Clostridia bacterium]|nr:aspartate kinase [Clostridia bacterium]